MTVMKLNKHNSRGDSFAPYRLYAIYGARE